jgi:hypothetical protein
MEQGNIIAVYFKGDKYLEFINHCFVNVLISGVHVKIVDVFAQENILFLTIAAPGIDRIDRVILKFEGKIVL